MASYIIHGVTKNWTQLSDTQKYLKVKKKDCLLWIQKGYLDPISENIREPKFYINIIIIIKYQTIWEFSKSGEFSDTESNLLEAD